MSSRRFPRATSSLMSCFGVTERAPLELAAAWLRQSPRSPGRSNRRLLEPLSARARHDMRPMHVGTSVSILRAYLGRPPGLGAGAGVPDPRRDDDAIQWRVSLRRSNEGDGPPPPASPSPRPERPRELGDGPMGGASRPCSLRDKPPACRSASRSLPLPATPARDSSSEYLSTDTPPPRA